MNLLSQIMSEEANDGALLVRVQISLKSIYAGTTTETAALSSPPWGYKVCWDWHGGSSTRVLERAYRIHGFALMANSING